MRGIDNKITINEDFEDEWSTLWKGFSNILAPTGQSHLM